MASEEQIDLPPGFRFHPTDEELITQYLSPKVLDHSFSAAAIGEVDMNKYEPWDLPWRGKMGEKEWYFFCVRDRKYPIGLRTNRATNAGYWKATGKDKEIYSEKSLVGMKKTLVFYKGRAPKGEKSNWVTHEYRLEGKHAAFSLPKPGKKVWVLCRVFLKGAGGRIPITRMAPLTPPRDKLDPSRLPSLMEFSPCTNSMTRTRIESASHVTCFSNLMEGETHDNITDNFNTGHLPSSSYPSEISTTSVLLPRMAPTREDSQQPYSMFAQENQILRLLLANKFLKTGQNFNPEISQETVLSTDMNTTDISSAVSNHEEVPSNCAGPVDIDSLWNY